MASQSNLRKWLQHMDSVIASVSRIMSIIGAFVVLAMMLLVVADVSLRSLFNRPITGSIELVELMMLMIISLGIAYVQYKKTNITVDLLMKNLSQKIQVIVSSFIYFLSLGIISLLVWQAFVHFQFFADTDRYTVLLKLPFAPFQLLIVIGCFMLALVLLSDFLQSISKAVKR